MVQNNSVFSNEYEYHADDLDCEYCLHSKKKSKFHKNGCREESCRYDDIRREAIEKGRIKRKQDDTEIVSFVI